MRKVLIAPRPNKKKHCDGYNAAHFKQQRRKQNQYHFFQKNYVEVI